jgi:glycosyltransferase involved in cell wall biosynthesis
MISKNTLNTIDSKSKKVSILIPMYNSERYISETIDSCLNQTHDNIEIIIVDDESTDRSYEIADRYAKEHYNVTLYRQDNSGAPAARNYAFNKSSGEYILFLDSDDILEKNKISLQLKDIETYGNENIYAGKYMRFVDSIKTAVDKPMCINKNYETARDWLVDSWTLGEMGQTSMWFAHRDLIAKAELWNEGLLKNQDGEFFCRVLLNSKSLIYNDEAIVYYRVNVNNSISRAVSKKSALSAFNSYKLYEDNIQEYINEDFKKALACCYLDFISCYYPNHPDLIKQALESIERLGYSFHEICRKKFVSKLSVYIGVNNALLLKHIYRNFRGHAVLVQNKIKKRKVIIQKK